MSVGIPELRCSLCSAAQIKENEQFIKDFVSQNGGIDAVSTVSYSSCRIDGILII